jgi:predicted HNH restriction endonuclease
MLQQAAEKLDLCIKCRWNLPNGVDVTIVSGCSKRPSSKAAVSEEARRTFRYVEPLSDTRTPLADFFSILLEGSKKWLAHFVRERNRSVVENKKADVLRKTGALACEICAFDFAQRFGSLGESFCEVHHRLPLAEADAPVATRLEDLAIVCSNCHRMLHRTSPALSVEGLKTLLTERSNNALHATCEDARA